MKQTLQFFYEEQVKTTNQYNFEKQKLAAAKKYSISQTKNSTIESNPIDRSLLLVTSDEDFSQ